MSLNEILSILGDFERFQRFQYCAALFPSLIAGIAVLAPVFILDQPSHRCFVDACDKNSKNVNDSWIHYAIPKSDSCHYFTPKNASNVTCDSTSFTHSLTKCSKYVYNNDEFKSTAVTEWDVVCDESWKVSFTQSLSMAGILISALVFGYLSDRYGRKHCFYWAPIGALGTVLFASFAPNFIILMLLSPLITFFVTGMYQQSFILGMEFIGGKWRIRCGNVVQIVFSIGELVLCLIAYFLQKWRKIEIIIAAIIFPLLFYPWILSESVRWQMSKGKYVSAMKTIERAAKWNRIELPNNLLFRLKELSNKPNEDDVETEKVTSSVIFKNSKLRRWTLNLFFCWAVNSLVYYGLSMQASVIGSNVYISFAFLAAIEIPFIIVINYLMLKFGNKISLVSAMVIGGISCILSAFFPNISMYLAVIGKGCIAASFSLIYIYTVEIYPTAVRGAGIGLCIMISRIGAILAPFVTELKIFGKSGPIIICGLFSFISGILVIDLPETHKRRLPETLEDIKHCTRFLHTRSSK